MEGPAQIYSLMSRCLSGEADEQEKENLADLLDKSPVLQVQYQLMQQWWLSQKQYPASDQEQQKITRILQLAAVEEALNEHSRPTKRKIPLYALAASVVLIVAAIALFYDWSPAGKQSNSLTYVVAQKGSKTRTRLPDGSTVWLNAGSRIEYEPSFSNSSREVTLFGEAYFDVVKQKGRPFIVHAGSIHIRVLGTAFNVKSYPEDKTVETTLIHGLVQITRVGDKKQEPLYLHPNQKIVLSQSTGDDVPAASTGVSKPTRNTNVISPITNLDSTIKENERAETAWIYNRLYFRGDDFEELAKKLERWYNISIRFQDETVRHLRFNGSLEDETVEEAFHALKTAVPFQYKINNNEIIVSSAD